MEALPAAFKYPHLGAFGLEEHQLAQGLRLGNLEVVVSVSGLASRIQGRPRGAPWRRMRPVARINATAIYHI